MKKKDCIIKVEILIQKLRLLNEKNDFVERKKDFTPKKVLSRKEINIKTKSLICFFHII